MARGEHVNPGTARSTKFTYHDFVHLPNDGKRHEIIDGEHYVTPSPNTKHQVVVGNLYLSIGGYLRERPVGFAFLAPFDVVFSNFDVVEPDLLYISRERMDVLTKANVRGAPDLLIEVLSPGTRRKDALIKRKLYERFGVQEYWIVDPERDVVKIHRRSGDLFGPAVELSPGQDGALTTPLLTGWSAPLREVFASPVAARLLHPARGRSPCPERHLHVRQSGRAELPAHPDRLHHDPFAFAYGIGYAWSQHARRWIRRLEC